VEYVYISDIADYYENIENKLVQMI